MKSRIPWLFLGAVACTIIGHLVLADVQMQPVRDG